MPGSFDAVEIVGFDPALDLGVASRAERLRASLREHAVICVRFDRALTDDEAQGVASMIGPIKDPIGRTRDGAMLRYGEARQIIDAGFVLTDELGGDALRPGLFETFHTDDAFSEHPASATVLRARELPAGPGGNTLFIDMRAAYRLLGREQQAQHKAAGDFPLGEPRNFWRYMTEGARPVAF